MCCSAEGFRNQHRHNYDKDIHKHDEHKRHDIAKLSSPVTMLFSPKWISFFFLQDGFSKKLQCKFKTDVVEACFSWNEEQVLLKS